MARKKQLDLDMKPLGVQGESVASEVQTYSYTVFHNEKFQLKVRDEALGKLISKADGDKLKKFVQGKVRVKKDKLLEPGDYDQGVKDMIEAIGKEAS